MLDNFRTHQLIMARDLAVFTQLPNELLKLIGSWFYYLQKIRATTISRVWRGHSVRRRLREEKQRQFDSWIEQNFDPRKPGNLKSLMLAFPDYVQRRVTGASSSRSQALAASSNPITAMEVEYLSRTRW